MLAKLLLFVTVVSANVARAPVEAWYKQVAGPSYYPVGRASGLLSGIRRWPYVRRAELEATDGGQSAGQLTEATPQKMFPLKTMVSSLPELSTRGTHSAITHEGASAHLTTALQLRCDCWHFLHCVVFGMSAGFVCALIVFCFTRYMCRLEIMFCGKVTNGYMACLFLCSLYVSETSNQICRAANCSKKCKDLLSARRRSSWLWTWLTVLETEPWSRAESSSESSSKPSENRNSSNVLLLLHSAIFLPFRVLCKSVRLVVFALKRFMHFQYQLCFIAALKPDHRLQPMSCTSFVASIEM